MSLFVDTFPSHMSHVLTLKQSTKEYKPHARMHHVLIVVIIVIIAMLTLCYSIMSHTTLILLSFYFFIFDQESMLTLQNSLISHELWLPQA
jgi:hypothetical protein